MEFFIFYILAAVEIMLAAFSFITKSNQKKIRSITRICEAAVLLLLIILSIIHWSFAYYALAVYFLILTILGITALIRKKEEKRPYKTKRIIWKTIGLIALSFIVTLPAILFPQYENLKPTGKYQVETKIYTYKDTNRIETYTNTGENRKVTVEFWYPKDIQGSYPLIVFSHGSFGIKESNETLYNELASHGYVVCSIDHTYQANSTTDVNGNTINMDSSYRKEILSENPNKSKQQSYEYYQKWMQIRTGDINFVIDYILTETKNNASDSVYKLVDTSKIGVIGHSLGGAAALGIGRMRKDIKAVISLEAPFMCDIKGVKDNKFVFTDEKYPVPLLNVYSDTLWGKLNKPDKLPQYAENYALLSNTNKNIFNVHIGGVGHLALTDMILAYPTLTKLLDTLIAFPDFHSSSKSPEECLRVINKLSLEFFDCYLKDNGQFKTNSTY